MLASVVSRDGTRIGWHRAGDGPPAVLVHGGAGNKANWIPCTPCLAARLALFAIDRRGRGRSGDSRQYAIEREYEDVAAVAEATGESVTLIGHSFGAIVALGATNLTGRVARVVLYEPPLLAKELHDCEQWATRIERLLGAGDRSAAASAFLERAATADEITRLCSVPPIWQQIEEDVATVPREIRALRAIPTAQFDHISVPVLLLAGGNTLPYLWASVQHLRSTLRSARMIELGGQGHLAQAFAPKEFCSEVVRFVDETEPA